jgi:hypothetical protein
LRERESSKIFTTAGHTTVAHTYSPLTIFSLHGFSTDWPPAGYSQKYSIQNSLDFLFSPPHFFQGEKKKKKKKKTMWDTKKERKEAAPYFLLLSGTRAGPSSSSFCPLTFTFMPKLLNRAQK